MQHIPDENPAGYYTVKDGRTRPDDLIHVYPGGGWLRADSPEWMRPTPDLVADCNRVVRRPGLSMPGATVRVYKMPATNADPGVAGSSNAANGVAIAQKSLFEL